MNQREEIKIDITIGQVQDPFSLQIGHGRQSIVQGKNNFNSDGIEIGQLIQPPGPLQNLMAGLIQKSRANENDSEPVDPVDHESIPLNEYQLEYYDVDGPDPEDPDYDDEDDDFINDETKEVIKIVNVHKTYLLGLEGVPALRGVNLTIQDGEFITILGTSGGGKTTMLNIIGTIDKPSKGDVYICGLRIKYSTSDQLLASIRLNKLGFVFQTFNLIGSLTALENVELPMQLRGKLSGDEIRLRAKLLLTEVGLGDRLEHFPNMLSGGEQQRVTIARSISNNPSILLLDEPTGDLDTKSTDIIMKILVDLNVKHQITMIMVTHDQGLRNFSNRVVKMSDGKILKIKNTNPIVRQQYIDDLNQRVIDHHLLGGSNRTQVREGITDEAIQRDLNRQGPPTIPKNFADLRNIYTTKTSIRKPSDYPILADRFLGGFKRNSNKFQ